MPGPLRGGTSSVKVAPTPEDPVTTTSSGLSRVALANKQLVLDKKLRYISLMEAAKIAGTNEWMGLADQVPTPELKQHLADHFVNVGVVSALLFTMVSLAYDEVGEKLTEWTDGAVSLEACQYTYSVLSSFAFVCFLVPGILHAFVLYALVSECTNFDEVTFWVKSQGRLVDVPYLGLMTGILMFALNKVFFFATITPMSVWLPLLCVILLMIFAQQHCVHRGIQGLYAAKMKVAEGQVADNFEGTVPDSDVVQELANVD